MDAMVVACPLTTRGDERHGILVATVWAHGAGIDISGTVEQCRGLSG